MKRTLDLLIASSALLVLSFPILVIAIGVRVMLGPPVLFRQRRPGLRGKPFVLLKFRTMREAVNGRGEQLKDEARLTRFGHFLRRTSLDELPQLWNVLLGEMSLVGPRPLLMEYLGRYTPRQARRHEARPGITGWAQVRGRNEIAWEEKLELDVWYVDHVSMWLDLRILAETIWAAATQRGISAADHVTMPEFMGGKGERTDRTEDT